MKTILWLHKYYMVRWVYKNGYNCSMLLASIPLPLPFVFTQEAVYEMTFCFKYLYMVIVIFFSEIHLVRFLTFFTCFWLFIWIAWAIGNCLFSPTVTELFVAFSSKWYSYDILSVNCFLSRVWAAAVTNFFCRVRVGKLLPVSRGTFQIESSNFL